MYRQPCDGGDEVCQASAEACSLVPDANGTTATVPATDCRGQYRDKCVGQVPCAPLAFVQPCNWEAHPRLLRQPVYTVPVGTPIDSAFPFPCAQGLLGSSDPHEQATALCAGPCPAGFTCGSPATTEPLECPRGHYCPAGSSVPLPCKRGSFSNVTHLSTVDNCTACPRGHFCPAGSVAPSPCAPGYVAALPNSSQCTPCGPGTYRTAAGGSGCDPCHAGHYCPRGAATPVPCPDGFTSTAPQLTAASQCAPCPAGHWCNSGQSYPCSEGYYTATDAPDNTSATLAACQRCPLHSTTHANGSVTTAACVCDANFFLASAAAGAATCRPCPTGTTCAQPGTTLASLPVDAGYWKPGRQSTQAKRCPHPATCAAGSSLADHYEEASDATCAPGRNVSGVYCVLCAEGHYFDDERERCSACGAEWGRVALVVVVVALAFATLAHALRRLPTLSHSLATAARRVSLQAKLKVCISYYQIVTQLDRVYAVLYPPAYRRIVRAVGAVFHVAFGWVPGVASACTGLGLQNELLLLTLLPVASVLVVLALVRATGRGLLDAGLPMALVVAFLCFPFVASRGFRALAPCDCFGYTDGTPDVCFLRGAYEVRCTAGADGAPAAPAGLRAAAWLAILLYAGAVPLGFAGLLFAARSALAGAAPATPLSRALRFLARDYEPR